MEGIIDIKRVQFLGSNALLWTGEVNRLTKTYVRLNQDYPQLPVDSAFNCRHVRSISLATLLLAAILSNLARLKP